MDPSLGMATPHPRNCRPPPSHSQLRFTPPLLPARHRPRPPRILRTRKQTHDVRLRPALHVLQPQVRLPLERRIHRIMGRDSSPSVQRRSRLVQQGPRARRRWHRHVPRVPLSRVHACGIPEDEREYCDAGAVAEGGSCGTLF